MGVGDADLGLRPADERTVDERTERANDEFAAERRKLRLQRAGRVIRRDRDGLGKQHRTGVEAGVHLHDGDAGDVVAGFDRALDRRCAAPARQQRGVNVQAAVTRQREQPRRQDQPVGGDDDHLGRGGTEQRLGGAGVVGELAVEAQAARLRDRDPVRERERLHRRGQQLHAAPGGPVGLGQDERDLEPGRVQARQGDAREIGSAGKGESHASPRWCGARPGPRRASSSASGS